MDITQKRLNIFNQPFRNKLIRLEALDENFKILDTLETTLISGNLTYDADNDLRRSGTLSVQIPKKFNSPVFTKNVQDFNLSIGAGAYIWLNRAIKVYIGLKDYKPLYSDFLSGTYDGIVWYNMGIYIIDTPSQSFSATENQISFNIIDLMAKYGKDRYGQLPNIQTVIPSDTYVSSVGSTPAQWIRNSFRSSFVSFLEDICQIKKYSISQIPSNFEYLPYDIEIKVGSTKLDVINKFREMIPNWEYFFDEDGVFIFQPIPSGIDYPTFPIDNTKVVQENISVEFGNVKNQIIIYGKQHSTTFFAETSEYTTTTISGSTYGVLELTFSGFKYDLLTFPTSKIGFTTPDLVTNSNNIRYLSIGNTTSSARTYFRVVPYQNDGFDSTAPQVIPSGTFEPSTSYVLTIFSGTFNSNGTPTTTTDLIFQLYSHYQAEACIIDNNPESPFYINNFIKAKNYYAGKAINDTASNDLTSTLLLRVNDYFIDDESLTSLSDGTIITFMSNISNASGCNVIISNYQGTWISENIPIITDATSPTSTITENTFFNDFTIWQIQYTLINNTPYFVLLGRLDNVATLILTDGEYSIIETDELCQVRCEYELYLYSNLNDSIKLNMFSNYLLSVNTRISYHNIYGVGSDFVNFVTNDNDNFITSQGNQFRVLNASQTANAYLIKRIEINLTETGNEQTITAMKIHPPLELVENPQLDTPNILLQVNNTDDDNVLISRVPNATSYKVYANQQLLEEVDE